MDEVNTKNIKYEDVNTILTKMNIRCPRFSVFNDRGNVIKVSYWQPYGKLEFESESGIHCCSEHHMDKATEFLKNAREKKVDVAITPEYSLPWEVLHNIFHDSSFWPYNMKLWCLGMEGISYKQLIEMKEQDKSDNVIIIIEDFADLNINEFFSCICYVFIADNKLICLIQLKTTPASDEWARLESYGLSTGNTIYYFKEQQTNCYLFSYICADALNQKVFQAEDIVKSGECIILHPQLNPKPLHDSFDQMRKSFLDYAHNSIRILSVNWAQDTSICIKDTATIITVQDSYSACYYNYDPDEKELSALMRENKIKGINLSKIGHIFCWHMPSKEHCMVFTIDNFKTQMLNNVGSKHNEPIGSIYLEYMDEGKIWQQKDVCGICVVDWQWLNEVFKIEHCDCNHCPIVQLHKFFSILNGEEMYKLLEIRDKQSGVVFNLTDANMEEVIKSRERCQFVSEALDKGNLPAKFSRFKCKNHQWILSNEGNLTNQDDIAERKKPVCVLYVDSSMESIIQQRIINFQELMGDDAMDRLLVYCLGVNGIKVYDKLDNKEVVDSDVTKNIYNINVG